MARSPILSSPDGDEEEESPPTRQSPRRARNTLDSPSPSPAASFSSDKENRVGSRQSHAKNKTMPPPRLPTPVSGESASPHANKRRRLGERGAPNASQAVHGRALEMVTDTQYYDPDQPMEERRAVRKGIRDLARELADSRAEYMNTESNGLLDTINKANDLYSNVKQTSDATLDSRLLVSTSEITVKRGAHIKLGDSSRGIEVDEFVSKCISFMNRGPSDSEAAITGSSTQRRRRRRVDSDDDNDVAERSGDEGDAYNWEWLGRKACFPNNLRPAMPGFLLGPLSVQKRVRKQTQRRERLQKRDPKDAVRPEELKAQDLQRVENSNLTTLCRNIYVLLEKRQRNCEQRVEEERGDRDLTEEEQKALMGRHGIADDGGLPLLENAVNPKSFGQTVENFFYISFLIRDGNAGIGGDSQGLPTLHLTEPASKDEIKEQGIQKHQAVFHLDFPIWEDVVSAFEIKESIIPHRQPTEGTQQLGATGWYG